MNLNPLNLLRGFAHRIVRDELRSSLADPDAFLVAWFNGGGQTKAGVQVNEQTSLSISRLYKGVRVLAEGVAKLPLPLYRRLPVGKERVTNHPAFQILERRPNPEMTPFTFRETLMGHALLWGNGYAEIERTNGGVPIAMHILRPDRVWPDRDAADQSLVYRVYSPGKPTTTLQPSDVFHLKGLGFDGLVGYNVIRLARQSLGLTIATETFGASWFGNGSRPAGTLKTPGKLSDTAYCRLRETFSEVHGGPHNANKTAILEEGTSWEAIGVPPDEAQFLQTREFQVEEIAAWLNLPPHKVGDLRRATNNNIEQGAIDFVDGSLSPWFTRIEEEASAKLLTPAERDTLYFEFLADAILRGDTTTRYNAYAKGIQFGWLCVDEVREMENKNPLPNGKGQLYLTPVNMQPAEVTERQAQAAAATPAGQLPNVSPGATNAPTDTSDDDTRSAGVRKAHRPLMLEAANRIVRRETEVLRRAAKKPETLATFVGKFYDEHRSYVDAALAPPVLAVRETFAALHGTFIMRPIDKVLGGFSSEYLSESRAELLEAIAAGPGEISDRIETLLARWEAEKPAAIADKLLTL